MTILRVRPRRFHQVPFLVTGGNNDTMPRGPAKKPHRGIACLQTFPGADYKPEELAVLKAVDAYKRRTGHKFPSLVELLDVLRSLGWQPPAQALPPEAPDDGTPIVPTVEPYQKPRNMGVQRNSPQATAQ